MSFLLQGGPILLPIVLCSVIGLAIFLERLLILSRWRRAQPGAIEAVVVRVRAGDLDAALEACEAQPGPVANVVATLLRARSLPGDDRDREVSVSGKAEIREMERGLRGLAVIARVSPLLGLLGTVVGLVQAFVAVSEMVGPPNPSVLASGIWQALLTTVAGLTVAIPAILSHEWLQSQVDRLTFDMEQAVSLVLTAVDSRRS